MTLITIVENIFKYGALIDKRNPARLSLSEFEAPGAQSITLRFELANIIDRNVQIESLGSGLRRLERLLYLKYGDKVSLTFCESGLQFRLVLEVIHEK
jgi:hypothetical protein